MGRLFGLISLGIVLGLGYYIYMRQAQSATVQGASDPAATVDFVGVRHDLMAIAQAERTHNSLKGGFVSLDELRSSGDLTMERTSRGPFSYSVDASSSGFRAIATYAGPNSSVRNISIDQDMRFSEQ